MNKEQFYVGLILLLMLAVGCRERVPTGGPPPVIEKAPAQGTTTSTASPQPVPTTTDGGDASPLPPSSAPMSEPPIAETAPPPEPDPGPAADENSLTEPPAGLLLALGSRDQGWDLVVAGEGDQLRTLVEQIAPAHFSPDFDVSPDGRQLLYAAAGDIWLLDIASGVMVNITNTPGRQEQLPRWLPGGEGFVCTSKPVEPAGNEDPFPGYLTRVGFDGTYEVLVETGRLSAPPAPAPDGETIAYSRAHERRSAPFLYRLGSGERPLDLASFDLEWVEKSWEASWSPDGQRLAWAVAGEREGEWVAREILLNLAEGTSTLLHSYRPLGIGGFIPAPRWAPDGSWLVFVARRDEQPGVQHIWKVDLESGLKEQLFSGCLDSSLVRQPAISPDGAWIAAAACGAGGDVRLLDAEAAAATWQAPAEVATVAWAAPAAVRQSLPATGGNAERAETVPRPPWDPGPVAGVAHLASPPPGLLVALGSMHDGWNLSVAGEDGRLRTLIEQVVPPSYLPDFDVAPEGQQLLYANDGDIWLLDMASGEIENVTHTPNRIEEVPRWWPAGSGKTGFVCGSRPVAEAPTQSYLTVVDFDDNYEVLVTQGALAAAPAPGPDGMTIAYSRRHKESVAPFLYRLGSGEEALDLKIFGLDWVAESWEASWSPDGRQLAWGVTGSREGVNYAAQIVLNLESRSHELLHQYEPGLAGGIAAPRWAPDGSWLTFMTLDLNPRAGGLWLYHLEPAGKFPLSEFFVHPAKVSHPAVSPDGTWIAVPTYDGTGVGLVDTGPSTPLLWTAPGEVGAVGWLAPGYE